MDDAEAALEEVDDVEQVTIFSQSLTWFWLLLKQEEEEEPRETDALIEGEEVRMERFPHLQ